jgi:hypothetical protein
MPFSATSREEHNTDVIQGTPDMLILKTLSLEIESADWTRRASAIARVLKVEG